VTAGLGGQDLAEHEDLETARGRRAAALLQDPLLLEAFETIRDRWEAGWRHSKLSESDRREEIYRCLAALDEVWLELQSVVTSGKMAEAAHDARQGATKSDGRTGEHAA
jgi:hypothetical protein